MWMLIVGYVLLAMAAVALYAQWRNREHNVNNDNVAVTLVCCFFAIVAFLSYLNQ